MRTSRKSLCVILAYLLFQDFHILKMLSAVMAMISYSGVIHLSSGLQENIVKMRLLVSLYTN
jgi:hypothetical protein